MINSTIELFDISLEFDSIMPTDLIIVKLTNNSVSQILTRHVFG